MATASLDYNFTTSVPAPATFRVLFAITGFNEFPDGKVFVLRSADDQLDRVADVDDLSVWPGTKDLSKEFYLADTVTKDYLDPDTASQGMDDVAQALDTLAAAYAKYRADFDPDRTGSVSAEF